MNKNDLKYFQYPYIMQDFFVIESLNALLSILDNVFDDIQEEFQVHLSSKEAKIELIKKVSRFHKLCLNCENRCFDNYHKRLPNTSYEQMNVNIKDLPRAFQKVTSAHFYMLELSLICANAIRDFAQKYTHDEEVLDCIEGSIFYSMVDYYVDNCIKDCRYNCFKSKSDHAYCRICFLIDDDLRCPLKGEIQISDIGEVDFPSVCIKKRI